MSKIVIIEDDPILARIYGNKLQASGNQVTVVGDGGSGIETVKSTKPDLVLVDLMLPNLSGIEVIKKLRRDINFTRLPIIAYSGADEDLMAEAQEANPTVLLSKKTMSPKEIFENVEAVLETSRMWNVFATHPTEIELAGEADSKTVAGRILIVEDDLIISNIVKKIVEDAGYETVVTDDGGEALRILSKDANFTAGVFDVEVPKIKGTDLLRHMRTEKRLMRIPVMMMTADESIRVQLDTHNAGASIFVPKPFERETFQKLFYLLVGKRD
jgi:CheY-like chemotaxis protein